MTKINVISGFLGAGKTTFIKKLLSDVFHGQKIVLIENEFGEIGIDGGFLKDAGIEITEMNSGCICCSLVGDFGTALREVLTKFTPDRIMIEPSGVGKLSDVIKAVEEIAKDTEVELDSSITVADATKCKIYMKNFGEFYNNQIEHADTIVLSRTQMMDQTKLEASVKLLQEKNNKAAIITTPWDKLEGNIILEAMNKQNSMIQELIEDKHHHEKGCGCGHHNGEDCNYHNHEHQEDCNCGHHHEENCEHHHNHEDHEHHHNHEDHEHHHHDENCSCGHGHNHDHDHVHHHAEDVFISWGKETPHQYSESEIKEILEVLANGTGYGIILRAKGIIAGEHGEWIQFDLVPGEYEIRKSSPDYTGRLCVIGSEINTKKLEELFHII